jgi:hypothetical protein
MRHLKTFLLVFLALPAVFSAEKRTAVSFNWDVPKFRELNYKKTIGKAKVDAQFSSGLVKAIEAQLRAHSSDLDISDKKELHSVAQESRFELVDLNGDGTPEVIVQPTGLKSGCGGTGNCPLWVFAKRSGGYQPILDVASVQLYRLERNKHQQFWDIAVASHDSASEKHIYVYRYSNGKYSGFQCYDAWWLDNPRNELRILKQPKITSCHL